jgi:hypothetical protein
VDIRSVAMTGSWLQPSVILEQPQANFTVGDAYAMYALVIDAAEIPPKPYIVTCDDDGHFKLMDISKVRRA